MGCLSSVPCLILSVVIKQCHIYRTRHKPKISELILFSRSHHACLNRVIAYIFKHPQRRFRCLDQHTLETSHPQVPLPPIHSVVPHSKHGEYPLHQLRQALSPPHPQHYMHMVVHYRDVLHVKTELLLCLRLPEDREEQMLEMRIPQQLFSFIYPVYHVICATILYDPSSPSHYS